MLVVEDLQALPEQLPYPVLTIGVFDGIHRGHQAILRELVQRAKETAGTSVVLSFDPHPQKIIRPAEAPLLLQTRRQKEALLRRLGIDVLIRLPFTRRLSLCTAEEFADRILFSHGIREIRVGGNFRFGHRRSGDFATLRRLGESLGFQVVEVAAVQTRGWRVSSTLIRRALLQGRASWARHLLGRPYQMAGMVVRGAGRGEKLGFPTANLHPENELVPACGVYATWAWIGGRCAESITNVGFRPTVDGSSDAPVVETHLLDFRGDLYGKRLSLDFWRRLRSERKFSGAGQLVEQIQRDARRARLYFERVGRLPAAGNWPLNESDTQSEAERILDV